MEVHEKVWVDPEFVNSDPHGRGCVSCHGGNDGGSTKEAAHVGVVRDPSAGADAPACNGCHPVITEKHARSIHFTLAGYMTAFEQREATPPAQVQAMFDARCASCHTSCGQCHISRPNSVEGGLIRGHKFLGTPSQQENCTACHGSRIGNEFRGENVVDEVRIPADVHYRNLMNCFDCHDQDELHGTGVTPPTRYDVPNAPMCLDCHPEVVSDDNNWHERHARPAGGTQLACQVCHAQPYKNCYQCHVALDSQGLEIPSRIDFRVGRNQDQNPRRPWEYEVKRHVPIAPNSFTDWGVTMTDYAAVPTWRFATPHNIALHTDQAFPPGYPEEASCLEGCHGNDEIFLTPAYIDSLVQEGVMVPEEVEANADVTADPWNK